VTSLEKRYSPRKSSSPQLTTSCAVRCLTSLTDFKRSAKRLRAAGSRIATIGHVFSWARAADLEYRSVCVPCIC
jgi:hypothetical protein